MTSFAFVIGCPEVDGVLLTGSARTVSTLEIGGEGILVLLKGGARGRSILVALDDQVPVLATRGTGVLDLLNRKAWRRIFLVTGGAAGSVLLPPGSVGI